MGISSTRGCVSFSLYGDGAKYAWGAFENARAVRDFYPGWVCRFYVEKGHYAVDALRREGAEVIEKDPLPGSGGMFWRFLTADDPAFTHVIIRDADSRITAREVAAVNEWIESDNSLHIIVDNEWHKCKPIIGGAWGVKVGSLKMQEAISAWPHKYIYGDDEQFLADVVWPALSDDYLRHSFDPGDGDMPLAFREEGVPHVCERVNPTFTLPHRCVLLSPMRFEARRSRFYENFSANAPLLKTPEWFVGREKHECILARHFDHIETYPHYYLATRDHMDILERSYVEKDELLFVFEDDAKIRPDFAEYFLRAFLSLPENWMGMMLGGQGPTDNRRELVSFSLSNSLARVQGCLGMHATLWNRKGIWRAWNHFHFWNRNTIDWAFMSLQREEPFFFAPAKWVVDIDPEAVQFAQS